MSRASKQEWYNARLEGMIAMRQSGVKLRDIGSTYGIGGKYASMLLCQAGVYERKPRKPASVVPKAAPTVPVKVGRWTRLAEIMASVIKRFTK